jgi:hypothetical protein
MKYRIFLSIVFCLAFYLSNAQMPGMGGQSGAMNSMNNLPQNTSNNGPSKKDEPPHGGEVKESGKYFIEVVFDAFAADEKLSVWVLRQNYKPAKIADAKGTVKIKYLKLGKEEDKELILADDKFICSVEDASQAFTAFITITIKGKEYRSIYNHKAM